MRTVTGTLETLERNGEDVVVLMGRPDQCVVPLWAVVVGVVGKEVTLGVPDDKEPK